MRRPVRNLLDREGRYFARLVVPKDLRAFMDGKSELRTPLGGDYRTALKALPGAVAALQHRIALAERRAAEAGNRPVMVGRYPLSFDQIALRNYNDRLAQDERLRNASPLWASLLIDDGDVGSGNLKPDNLAGFVSVARELGLSVLDPHKFLREEQQRVFQWANTVANDQSHMI